MDVLKKRDKKHASKKASKKDDGIVDFTADPSDRKGKKGKKSSSTFSKGAKDDYKFSGDSKKQLGSKRGALKWGQGRK